MLARIAHELYWLGRNLARAEFTARAVEAVLQAELQGASDTAPGVSFGSGGLLAMLGDERRLPRPQPDARSADPRSRAPGIDAGEHRTVARGGAHGPRRDQRGDVAGDQHHRPRTGGRRTARLGNADGSVPRLAVHQGAHVADLGHRQPLDAPRRGEVLPRRGRADRDLRHGAADAPRGDAARRLGSGGRDRADPAAGGRRLSCLPAGGDRSPERRPGGPLPAVRALLSGQRGRLRGLAARGLHRRRHRPPQLQAGAEGQPAGGRPRLPAPGACRRGRS